MNSYYPLISAATSLEKRCWNPSLGLPFAVCMGHATQIRVSARRGLVLLMPSWICEQHALTSPAAAILKLGKAIHRVYANGGGDDYDGDCLLLVGTVFQARLNIDSDHPCYSDCSGRSSRRS